MRGKVDERPIAAPGKPLKPALASNRIVNSPVTPRLATATATDVRSRQSPAPYSTQITPGATSSICNNVTPRSSSRKSRVDSASSTPGVASPRNTPTGSRPTSGVEMTTSSGNDSKGQGSITKTGSNNDGRNPDKPGTARATPFMAARVKSAIISPASDLRAHAMNMARARSPERFPVPKKVATFFYANGKQEESAKQRRSPSPTLSAVSARSGKGQFFHADGTVEDDDVSPLPKLSRANTDLSDYLNSTAGRTSAMPGSASSSTVGNFHLSYRKGVSQILKPGSAHSPVPSFITSPKLESTPRRRSSSIDFSLQRPHKRTSSSNSIENDHLKRSPQSFIASLPSQEHNSIHDSSVSPNLHHGAINPVEQQPISTPAPLIHSQSFPIMPASPLMTPIEERLSDLNGDEYDDATTAKVDWITSSVPQSPTKSATPGGQIISQLVEAAANARRERKVLDLEISNSSLLAINRQLEKEVRKQKAELRRFRRLTRAGRISSVSMAGSDANVDIDASLSHESGLDAISEDESCEEEEDQASDSESSTDSTMVSPADLAGKDARRLERDSRRLQIDLSKHRQLIVDSQKMNQSLKRCMAWTEEMIRDGKRQLDYRIQVADVQLGGKVLTQEHEHEHDDEQAVSGHEHGLLGPWSPTNIPQIESSDGILGLGIAVQRTSWQSENDSGVEVESNRFSDHYIPGSSKFEADSPYFAGIGS